MGRFVNVYFLRVIYFSEKVDVHWSSHMSPTLYFYKGWSHVGRFVSDLWTSIFSESLIFPREFQRLGENSCSRLVPDGFNPYPVSVWRHRALSLETSIETIGKHNVWWQAGLGQRTSTRSEAELGRTEYFWSANTKDLRMKIFLVGKYKGFAYENIFGRQIQRIRLWKYFW